jgi:hypothetical protein
LPASEGVVAATIGNFGPTNLTSDTMWQPDKLLFGSDGPMHREERVSAAAVPSSLFGRIRDGGIGAPMNGLLLIIFVANVTTLVVAVPRDAAPSDRKQPPPPS